MVRSGDLLGYNSYLHIQGKSIHRMPPHNTNRNHTEALIMKKIIIMLTILLTTLLSAQTSFTVGTNSVPVIFEDAQLSQTNRVLICNDLNRVFAFEACFTNLVTFFTNQTGNAVGYLKPREACIYPFRSMPLIRIHDSKFSLVIDKKLSLRYSQCFTANIIQTNQLQQADAFVAMLNAGGASNLTATQKSKLYWLPEGYYLGTPEQNNFFADDLSNYKFYPPSILTARWLEVDIFPGKHLAIRVIARYKNNLSKIFDTTIAYDGEQWRFLMY